MTRRALLLLVLLPLAGCLGDPASVETASDAGTLPAGAASPGNATAPVLAASVDWDGKLGTVACIPMGPNACMAPRGADEDASGPLPRLGGPGNADLTITWKASSPFTEHLVVRLISVKTCGDGCYEGTEFSHRARGPSPLALAAELPALPEGESFLLLVQQPRLTPEPVYGYARLEQPFHVEGVLAVTA